MEWSLLSIFWLMLYFFLFILWIWLLIAIFGDIFRSEISGFAKALWILFVLVTPFLGVLIYLVVNGGEMQKRTIKAATEAEQAQKQYIREVASSTSTADELAKLSSLRSSGVITAEEFDAQKAKLLA